MEKFILTLVALVLCISSVNAAENTPVQAKPTVEEKVREAQQAAETKVRQAAEQAQNRAAEAARRASLTFTEARYEDLTYVGGSIKWGAMQAGRGVMNADGYVAAGIAYPAGYAAGGAFSAAEYLTPKAK